jgi:hypothetical protein
MSQGLIKPPAGSVIDWNHPLARDLAFYAPFLEGSGVQTLDLAGGAIGVLNVGGTPPTWTRNRNLQFHGSGSYIDFGTPGHSQDVYLGPGQRASWDWKIKSAATQPAGYVFVRSDGNSNTGYIIGTNSSMILSVVYSGPDQNYSIGSGSVPSQPGWNSASAQQFTGTRTYVLTYDNALFQGKLYLDGQLILTANHVSGGAQGSDATRHLYISGSTFNTPGGFDQELEFAAIWKGRILTDQDVALLTHSPYAMMRAKTVWREYFIVGAGPQTITPAVVMGPRHIPAPGLDFGYTPDQTRLFTIPPMMAH